MHNISTIFNNGILNKMSGVGDNSHATAGALIKPATRREELFAKLDEFKENSMTARDSARYRLLNKNMNVLLAELSWSRFGVSSRQLGRLSQDNLDELAKMTYERSRVPGLIQTGVLMLTPIIGWTILAFTLGLLDEMASARPLWCNLRYFWWYRRMKNKYKPFKPSF